MQKLSRLKHGALYVIIDCTFTAFFYYVAVLCSGSGGSQIVLSDISPFSGAFFGGGSGMVSLSGEIGAPFCVM